MRLNKEDKSCYKTEVGEYTRGMQDTLTPKPVTRADLEAVLVFLESLLADEPTDDQVAERVEATRAEIRSQLEESSLAGR